MKQQTLVSLEVVSTKQGEFADITGRTLLVRRKPKFENEPTKYCLFSIYWPEPRSLPDPGVNVLVDVSELLPEHR